MMRRREFALACALCVLAGCGGTPSGKAVNPSSTLKGKAITLPEQTLIYFDERIFRKAIEFESIQSTASAINLENSDTGWTLLYPGTEIRIIEEVSGGVRVVVEYAFRDDPTTGYDPETGATKGKTRAWKYESKIGWIRSKDLPR